MEKKRVGRPTKYNPEYGDRLIEHMKGGNSLEAFCSLIGVSKQTAYQWLEKYPEFYDARKRGEGHLHLFYENMGKVLASGQMRRVKSEKARVDKDGKPYLDANGKAIYDREYEYTAGSTTAWIFLCKNLIFWRDRKDIEVSGKEGKPIEYKDMSDDELLKYIEKLTKEK